MDNESSQAFWVNKSLEEMTQDEWEQVCDGCGLCCLVRVQDEDSGVIFDTNVVCTHYDCDKQQCSSYSDRTSIDGGCVQLTPALVREFDWLPDSCAYRTLMRGENLPSTHPLVSGVNTTPTVVEQFAATGLISNSDDLDPVHYLIIPDGD